MHAAHVLADLIVGMARVGDAAKRLWALRASRPKLLSQWSGSGGSGPDKRPVIPAKEGERLGATPALPRPVAITRGLHALGLAGHLRIVGRIGHVLEALGLVALVHVEERLQR